jgi:hypothetical protein
MLLCKLQEARELYELASRAVSASINPPAHLSYDLADRLYTDMVAWRQECHVDLVEAMQTATTAEMCEHLDILMERV